MDSSNNNKDEKLNDYLVKGIAAFEQDNFREALHFFKESMKIKETDEAKEYIEKCNKKIEEIKKQKEAQKEENQSNNNNSEGNNNESNDKSANSTDDEECEKIINCHDYYEILGAPKDASNDVLKKCYKKKAIKFHPDKNHSPKAEEAFKRVATAYQTLTDPEKKQIYDKYGSDEQYREKYYQAHQQQYEEEEFDPFDIFQMMFMGGMDPATLERIRRRQRAQMQNRQPVNPRVAKWLGLLQLLPVLFMFIVYVYPYITMKHENFAFHANYEYPFKRMTFNYKVPYYVGNEFVSKYNGDRQGLLEKEKYIEDKYLEYLDESCKENTKQKNQIEYHMKFQRKGSYYYSLYLDQLNSLDLKVCDKYKKYKKKINKEIEKDFEEDKEKEEEKEKEKEKETENKNEDDDDGF